MNPNLVSMLETPSTAPVFQTPELKHDTQRCCLRGYSSRLVEFVLSVSDGPGNMSEQVEP